MSSIIVRPGDPDAPVAVEGLAVIGRQGEWRTVDRLPADGPHFLAHPDLRTKSAMPSGARIVVRTDATGLLLEVWCGLPSGLKGPVPPFDIIVDGRLVARRAVSGESAIAVDGLDPAPKTIEIWLPQFGHVRLGELRLLEASTALPTPSAGPAWVAYGSSITQCRTAAGPSETWPALVARNYGYALRNLGFGGEAHLDQDVARFIGEVPADLVSVCLGINVYGSATFSPRSLGPAVQAFIRTIRAGHPGIPLVVITPISSPDREAERNAVGLSLRDVRDIIAASATSLGRHDELLRLVDGRDLFGPDDANLLPDGLHPGPDGYRLFAERVIVGEYLVC